jgi:hypothetical protein
LFIARLGKTGVVNNVNSIPLRHFRALSRKPSIEAEADQLILRLPGIFGKHPWRIPAAEVAVLNMRNLDVDADEEPHADREFVTPVAIPLLATASELRGPSIALLFRHPQRVPPLRRVGGSGALSARRARSQEGLWLDGVGLQAVDPVQAVISLIASGAERVIDPHSWLQDHRDSTKDTELLAARSEHDRQTKWASAVALLSLFVLLCMRWAVDHTDGWWPAPTAFACMGLLLGYPIWVGRLHRRLAKQAQTLSADKIIRRKLDGS